jgi:hypothetical protein
MPFSGSGAASGAAAGSAFGPWGALIGGVAGGFFGGSKAQAPAMAPPVDLQAEQAKAIAGNTANESSIEALLGRANTFQQEQASSLLEKAMPGYGALSKSLTATAQSELADPYGLPKDVQDNIAQLAAERGISAGTKGEFNDFSLLRDFGINSLQYGQSRINSAQGITGLLASIAPKVNPLSPMSMFVTPGQQQQNAQQQQSATQAGLNADAAAANFNDANSWDSITKAAGFLGSSGVFSNMGSTPAKGKSGTNLFMSPDSNVGPGGG